MIFHHLLTSLKFSGSHLPETSATKIGVAQVGGTDVAMKFDQLYGFPNAPWDGNIYQVIPLELGHSSPNLGK